MDNHVYKIVELVGTSPDGVGEAVENALQRASQTIRISGVSGIDVQANGGNAVISQI